MKKSLTYTFILIALILLLTDPVSFAVTPIIFTADTTLCSTSLAGESILVPIRITNNPGLAGAELTITLDSGLEWDCNPAAYNNDSSASATWPYIPGGSINLTGRPPTMGTSTFFTFINVEDIKAFDFIGDGVLLTLKLKISGNVKSGDTLTVGINILACGNTAATGYAPAEFISVDGLIIVASAVDNYSGNDRNDSTQTESEPPISEGNQFGEMVLQPKEWDNPFSDVSHTDWFYDEVALVHTNGLIIGTSPTTFSPNTSVTRAMFARILANFERVELNADTVSRFTDVPVGQWYTYAIKWADDMGIATGYGNNLFGPNDEITREQMAVMLNNYLMSKGILFPAAMTPSAFTDEKEISSWAVESVKTIQATGIISGRPGNIYAPSATATRAEIAAILARFIRTLS